MEFKCRLAKFRIKMKESLLSIIFPKIDIRHMAKRVSSWYLHSGRSKRSQEVVKLLSIGKGRSISEAVNEEKRGSKDARGVSEDGSITVRRVGTVSTARE